MHYGARLPMTPLAIPFVHHTMPIIGGKSIVKPLRRLISDYGNFSDIERNHDVVFNWPAI